MDGGIKEPEFTEEILYFIFLQVVQKLLGVVDISVNICRCGIGHLRMDGTKNRDGFEYVV